MFPKRIWLCVASGLSTSRILRPRTAVISGIFVSGTVRRFHAEKYRSARCAACAASMSPTMTRTALLGVYRVS